MGRKGKDEVFGGGLPGRGVAIMKRKVEEKLKEKGFKKDMSGGPAGKLSTAENELDSYNKFVEKVADGLGMGPSGLGKRPPKILFERTTPPMPRPQRFRKNQKKQVLDSSGKPVKNLKQDMADGGEVFNMSTEMVIDE